MGNAGFIPSTVLIYRCIGFVSSRLARSKQTRQTILDATSFRRKLQVGSLGSIGLL